MKEFEKWLKEQIDFYSPILGLSLIKIETEYNKDKEYLEIMFTYPYNDPTIYYSDEVIEDYKKGKLRTDRVLHELMHIITDPFYYKAIQRFSSRGEIEDEREKLTDDLTAIIRNLIK